ncbi:MAG: SH3 domain-containing protein [Candidatus Coatesbacteria bacterium]|nr:MAG: SH3 domain-containing protein [Candidatus Coatesbacteria bacterium]
MTSVKCPNCGGAVRGRGQVTCPYCGSTLEIPRPGKSELRRITSSFGTPGTTLRGDEPVHFAALPGVDVTADTTDLPFQPQVTYASGPLSKLEAALQAEANEILRVVETTQEAVNREDLDLYLSTIHPEYRAFYEKARRGAEQQFVAGDMKRYTVAVDFTSLTRENAAANVTIEAFIFLPSGYVNHVHATFAYKLKKFEGAWKIYASRIKGAGGVAAGRGLIVVLAVSVGMFVVLGLVVAILVGTCAERAEEITFTKTVTVEPESGEITVHGDAHSQRPKLEGHYVAETGIPLYQEPDLNSRFTTVLTPGTQFKVLERKGDWYRIESENGARGWVPEIILGPSVDDEVRPD